jgi:hypothetical protein
VNGSGFSSKRRVLIERRLDFAMCLFGAPDDFTPGLAQMFLLLLEPESVRSYRLELQTGLANHQDRHHEADGSKQAYHPEDRLSSLGHFHGGASFFMRVLRSDHKRHESAFSQQSWPNPVTRLMFRSTQVKRLSQAEIKLPQPFQCIDDCFARR